MTELDGELPGLALELIAEFGADLLYTIVSEGAYDPATSRNTTSEIEAPVKAIVEDYSLQGSGQAYASGLVEAGDKKLTVAAQSFEVEPSPSDFFILNGSRYLVKNVKAVYSGQLVAAYEIQGRA